MQEKYLLALSTHRDRALYDMSEISLKQIYFPTRWCARVRWWITRDKARTRQLRPYKVIISLRIISLLLNQREPPN